MAELASVRPYQLTIPNNCALYGPGNLPLHDWKTSDFTEALKFGDKFDPSVYDSIKGAVGDLSHAAAQRFSTEGQLAHQEATDAAYDYNHPSLPSLENSFKGGTIANAPAANLSSGSIPQSETDLMAGRRLAPLPTTSSADASTPNLTGTYNGTGTVFAGPKDTANFARTGSLATGDNGVGKWGQDTTDPNVPLVAVRPSILRENGIDPNHADGTPVLVNVNGTPVQAKVGDYLGEHSPSGAAIDLNPGVAKAAGIDPDNFKGPVSFTLNHTSTPSSPPLFGFQSNVDPASNGRQQASTTTLAPTTDTSAAEAVARGPMPAVGEMPVRRAEPVISPGWQNAQATASDPNLPTIAPVVQPSRRGMSGPLLMPQGNTALSPAEMNFVLSPAPRETYRDKMERTYGEGHFVVDAKGGTSYVGSNPRTDSQQQLDQARANRLNQLANPSADAKSVTDENGNVIGHEVNGRFVRLPATGNAGTLDQRSDLQVQRDLARAGGDPAQFMDAGGKKFDRTAALGEIARRNGEAPDPGSTGSKPMTEYQQKALDLRKQRETRLNANAGRQQPDSLRRLGADMKSLTGRELSEFQQTGAEDTHAEDGGVSFYMGGGDGTPKERVFLNHDQYAQFKGRLDALQTGPAAQGGHSASSGAAPSQSDLEKAAAWAAANPDDPRAAEIKKRLNLQ